MLRDEIASIKGEVTRLANQKASREDQVGLVRGDLVETVGAIESRDSAMGRMARSIEDLTLELAHSIGQKEWKNPG